MSSDFSTFDNRQITSQSRLSSDICHTVYSVQKYQDNCTSVILNPGNGFCTLNLDTKLYWSTVPSSSIAQDFSVVPKQFWSESMRHDATRYKYPICMDRCCKSCFRYSAAESRVTKKPAGTKHHRTKSKRNNRRLAYSPKLS